MRRNVAVLALVQAVDVLGYALLLPQAQFVRERFGFSAAGLWALFSAPLVATSLGAVLFLPLSQRYGRKPVLVGTCLVTAEALFVLAWAGDVYLFVMARLMAGLAAGNLAVADAALGDADDGSSPERTTALACVAGLVAGWLIGLVVPPGPAAYLGGALAVASLVGVVSLLPETHPAHASGMGAPRPGGGAIS